MTPPLVSVVVPTYNRRRILSRTLPSILSQNAREGGYEVIVVVDGSADGTLEMLGRTEWGPRLRVVSQPNRGLASARNRGAAEARGAILLFLDDDMIAAPGLVTAHAEEHGASRSRVVLGRMDLAADVRRSFLKLGVEEWGREFAERVSAPGYRFRFDDVHFGNASISRPLFESLGGFDESFVAFGNEDYDLGFRLMRGEPEIRFTPRAVALQIYDKSFFRWLRDVRSVGRADLTLAAKHPSLAGGLRFSARESHALKRLARWSGQASLDPLAPFWTGLAWFLAGAERLALRGRTLSHAQSLMGSWAYWRGVRDSRPPVAAVPGAARSRTGRAA